MKLFFSVHWWLIAILLTIAVNLKAAPPICYASYNGDDTRSGFSMGEAKQSIMACYDQIMGGVEATPNWGGTIYIMDGGAGHAVNACRPTDPSGCGIWVLSGHDPNFSRLPPGWRKAPGNGSPVGVVAFIGVAGVGSGQARHGIRVQVNAGSGTDNAHPAVWLSGICNFVFKNLSFSNEVKSSVCSNGVAECGTNDITFDNCAVFAPRKPGLGPAFEIGSYTVTGWITNSEIYGNNTETDLASPKGGLVRKSNVATFTSAFPLPSSWTGKVPHIGITGSPNPGFNGTFTITVTGPSNFTYPNPGPDTTVTGCARNGCAEASSDQSAAILINRLGQASAGAGGLHISDSTVFGGGIKFYGGNNSSTMTIERLLGEDEGPPPVWISSCWPPSTTISISDILISDAAVPTEAVRSDCGTIGPEVISVRSALFGTYGPMTVINGQTNYSGPNRGVSATAEDQSGLLNGRLIGTTNVARRGFGPVATRFRNIASQVISNWPYGGAKVTAVDAPDGTSNAGEVSVASGSGSAQFYYNASSPKVTPGDYIIASVWARARTSYGFDGGVVPVQISCPNGGCLLSMIDGNDLRPEWSPAGQEWFHLWGVYEVLTAVGNGISFSGNVNASSPTDFFAPVLLHIPAGTISRNEAAEIGTNLQAYRDDANPGQVSLLRGEQFKADSIQVGDGPVITSGLGPPKGSASPGSIYLRRDGSPGSTFYIYENHGWKGLF